MAFCREEVELGHQEATFNMATLSNCCRTNARFNAHAATDITGFGILGHSQNLVKKNRNEVSFVICNLPIIAKMAAISQATRCKEPQQKLLKGY